jgi:chemotaxis protein CheD
VTNLLGALLSGRQVVGIADMKVSANPDDVLITYALGSCLGIAAHDPAAGVGGLIHIMLPTAAAHMEKSRENPFMFVDTGVPRLFQEMYRQGAVKERIVVKVAGGATSGGDRGDFFQIGRNNMHMLRKIFWKNGITPAAQEVGGQSSRTLSVAVGSGTVILKTDGAVREL